MDSELECYKTAEQVAFLRLELKSRENYLFPYAALVFAKLQPEAGKDDEDALQLTFASHAVDIHGFRLAEVLEQVQKATCALIRESNRSHAPFGERPAVVRIVVRDLRGK